MLSAGDSSAVVAVAVCPMPLAASSVLVAACFSSTTAPQILVSRAAHSISAGSCCGSCCARCCWGSCCTVSCCTRSWCWPWWGSWCRSCHSTGPAVRDSDAPGPTADSAMGPAIVGPSTMGPSPCAEGNGVEVWWNSLGLSMCPGGLCVNSQPRQPARRGVWGRCCQPPGRTDASGPSPYRCPSRMGEEEANKECGISVEVNG